MDSLTLDEALDLFKLPRTLGEFEGQPVSVGVGRFGPYVQHAGKYASIPKGTDPLDITLDEAERLLLARRAAEASRHIKPLMKIAGLEVLNRPLRALPWPITMGQPITACPRRWRPARPS